LFFGEIPNKVSTYLSYKKNIRIIICARPKDSCREYFKALQILPLAAQYILSIVLFMIFNKDLFKIISEIHSFNTRGNTNFFQPMTNLKICQKEPCCSGIKLYNKFPLEISKLSDIKLLKDILRKFLLKQPFYTLEEYFSYKTN
jgi:hypothetical protein